MNQQQVVMQQQQHQKKKHSNSVTTTRQIYAGVVDNNDKTSNDVSTDALHQVKAKLLSNITQVSSIFI